MILRIHWKSSDVEHTESNMLNLRKYQFLEKWFPKITKNNTRHKDSEALWNQTILVLECKSKNVEYVQYASGRSSELYFV